MDKTSEKVTKDPKRQEQGKKSHETYMKRLKEKILEDNQLPTPSPTDRQIGLRLLRLLLHLLPLLPLPIPQDQIYYGRYTMASMALVYVLPLPLVFVYFLHNTFQAKNKNQANEKKINHHNNFMF